MDSVSLSVVLEVARAFGPMGLVLLFWWLDMRQIRGILEKYQNDMNEIREMYRSNAALVTSYQDLTGRLMKVADDFSEVVSLNAQAMTKINDSVLTNQYCPQVRLVKVAKGRVSE